MSETVSSGPAAPSSSDERNLAFLSYALLFASPFTAGLSGLIAAIIAYVRKGVANADVRSHYRFQIFVFWVALGLTVVGLLAFALSLGMVLNDVVHTATNSGQGWDAFDVAAFDEDNIRVRPSSFTGFVVGVLAWVASGFWAMLAALVGFIRLASRQTMTDAGV